LNKALQPTADSAAAELGRYTHFHQNVIIDILFIHNCDMENIHVSGRMKRGLAET
jgi:hypothetical protein